MGVSLISGFWHHIDECSCLLFNHRLPEPIWGNITCTQESCASDSGWFFLYNRENYIHLFYTCPVNGIWCLEWGDFLHLLIYTEPKTGLSSHCMRADCRYAIIATGCLNAIILKSEHIYNRCCQCSTAVKILTPVPFLSCSNMYMFRFRFF